MEAVLLYDNKRFVAQELVDGYITDDSAIVELHCGDCLAIQVKKQKWIETRIEKDTDDDVYGWYFTDVGRAAPLIGHTVRIKR